MVERAARLRAALPGSPTARSAGPLDATGRPEGYALLTGSSSIFHALRCGVALRRGAGGARPDWELAAGRLGHAVAHHPGSFAPEERVRDGLVLPGPRAARSRATPARDGWTPGCATYVLEGLGVRCVSTSDWVTAAETAECAIALDALGRTRRGARAPRPDRARTAATTARTSRASPTPSRATFPGGETTSYTAAAVVLAADALSSTTRGGGAVPRRAAGTPLDLPAGRCRGAWRQRLHRRLSARRSTRRLPVCDDLVEVRSTCASRYSS